MVLEEQGSDEADNGGLVMEDPDDIAATLDFAGEAFERVRAAQFGTVLESDIFTLTHTRRV